MVPSRMGIMIPDKNKIRNFEAFPFQSQGIGSQGPDKERHENGEPHNEQGVPAIEQKVAVLEHITVACQVWTWRKDEGSRKISSCFLREFTSIVQTGNNTIRDQARRIR